MLATEWRVVITFRSITLNEQLTLLEYFTWRILTSSRPVPVCSLPLLACGTFPQHEVSDAADSAVTEVSALDTALLPADPYKLFCFLIKIF